MSEPRHISECITEWLDQYAELHTPTPRDPATVVAAHVTGNEDV